MAEAFYEEEKLRKKIEIRPCLQRRREPCEKGLLRAYQGEEEAEHERKDLEWFAVFKDKIRYEDQYL